MSKIQLTIACGEYDRTRPLITGEVVAEGIDLNVLPLSPGETFWRMLNNDEFDASEMSLSSYSILRSQGDTRFTAIPVFLSRTFRHNALYINRAAAIKRPADLKGKRIGVGDYQMTAAVWVRGFLQEDFGVKPEDLEWFTGRPIRRLPGGAPVPLQLVESGCSLENLLLRGQIDALVSVVVPQALAQGNDVIERLFPDYKRVEKEYYVRTGIFPIMHAFVIKTAILETHPWVALSLYKAFTDAKIRAEQWIYDTNALAVSLPWLISEIEETRALFGDDPWDYSLHGSAQSLKALLRHLHQQGLTASRMQVSELFAPQVGEGLQDYLRSTGEH